MLPIPVKAGALAALTAAVLLCSSAPAMADDHVAVSAGVNLVSGGTTISKPWPPNNASFTTVWFAAPPSITSGVFKWKRYGQDVPAAEMHNALAWPMWCADTNNNPDVQAGLTNSLEATSWYYSSELLTLSWTDSVYFADQRAQSTNSAYPYQWIVQTPFGNDDLTNGSHSGGDWWKIRTGPPWHRTESNVGVPPWWFVEPPPGEGMKAGMGHNQRLALRAREWFVRRGNALYMVHRYIVQYDVQSGNFLEQCWRDSGQLEGPLTPGETYTHIGSTGYFTGFPLYDQTSPSKALDYSENLDVAKNHALAVAVATTSTAASAEWANCLANMANGEPPSSIGGAIDAGLQTPPPDTLPSVPATSPPPSLPNLDAMWDWFGPLGPVLKAIADPMVQAFEGAAAFMKGMLAPLSDLLWPLTMWKQLGDPGGTVWPVGHVP